MRVGPETGAVTGARVAGSSWYRKSAYGLPGERLQRDGSGLLPAQVESVEIGEGSSRTSVIITT